jgi:hypothetical protein
MAEALAGPARPCRPALIGVSGVLNGEPGGREAAEELRAGPCLLVAAERDSGVARLQVPRLAAARALRVLR